MRLFLLSCILLGISFSAVAQIRDPGLTGRSGGKALYGEVIVEGEQLNNGKPVRVDLILYTESRNVFERNTVSGNTRYRFNNIPQGLYELVAEVDGVEVARLRVDLRTPLVDDFKQDVTLAWTSTGPNCGGAASASPAPHCSTTAGTSSTPTSRWRRVAAWRAKTRSSPPPAPTTAPGG